jgi:tetratricopeptide (TPR) repeat protein
MEYKLGSVEQEQEHRVVAKYERLKALGTGKFKEKKYEEAMKYYNAAADVIYSADGDTSSDPTRLSYYVVCKSNAAQCCINLNDFKGAIGYASSAILKDPTNAKALYRRGTSFMAITRFDSAIDDLRSCIALTLDPRTKRDVEKELKNAVNMCLHYSIALGDLEN